jgi:hypothetical protein
MIRVRAANFTIREQQLEPQIRHGRACVAHGFHGDIPTRSLLSSLNAFAHLFPRIDDRGGGAFTFTTRDIQPSEPGQLFVTQTLSDKSVVS